MVAEAKYGNSQLGMTKDGRQMSSQWINKRLAKLAKPYQEVATNRPTFAKYPTKGKMPSQKIEIELSNGKKGVFWRNNAQDAWQYDGPPGTLREAQSKAGKTATYLGGAATGKISYRTRLFRFKLDGNTIKVSVGDPSKLTNSGKVLETDTYEIKLSGLKRSDYVKTVQQDIARQIRSKFPHISEKEAFIQAKKITDHSKNLQEMVEASRKALAKSLAISTMKASAIGTLAAGGFEAISQLISEGKIDLSEVGKQLSLGAVSSGTGALAGQATVVFLTKSQLGYNSMLRLSSALNLPTASIAANFLGTWVGGALASTIFAYGQVFTGACDWAEANRMAATGVIATTSGVIVSSATMSAAVAFGTASTGTAISSLSGAAATNAALAWLGGGATSAGGFGIAGGVAVLGGAVTI